MKKRLYQALSALGVLLFLSSFYVPVKGEPLMVLGTDTTPPLVWLNVYAGAQSDTPFQSFYNSGGTVELPPQPGDVLYVTVTAKDTDSYVKVLALYYPGGSSIKSGTSTSLATMSPSFSMTPGWSGVFDVYATNRDGITRSFSVKVTVSAVYTLTIQCDPTAGGTTNPSPGNHSYAPGTDVTVTAYPNSGYMFVGWEGSITSSNTTVSVKMDSDKRLVAKFRLKPTEYWTLTVSVNPSGAGSVTKEPNYSSYANGTQVKLTAIPSSAVYYFTGWSGDASGTSNPLTVTMDRNRNITANFARKDDPAGNFYINNQLCTPTSTLYLNTRSLSFKFVPTKSAGEISRVWVEIKGPETLNVDLTKQSDGSWTGQYTFGKDGSYTINCRLSWAGGTVTIASITFGGQEEVPPGYAKIEYICLPRIGGGLVGAKSPVPLGTHIEVEAFPNQGWRFVGWKGDVPPDYTYQKLGFIADKENMVIIAEFKSIEPMISTPTAMRIFGAILILSGAVGWLVERKKHAW